MGQKNASVRLLSGFQKSCHRPANRKAASIECVDQLRVLVLLGADAGAPGLEIAADAAA